MYKPTCDNCGELDTALVDGYHIRDRALEDVFLEVTFKDGVAVSAKCQPIDEDYMDDFNTEKIYQEAVDMANQSDTLTCPKCGDDIDGPYTTPVTPVPARMIPMVKILP